MSKNVYPALNAHHGIPGQVTFREGTGGMAVADVTNAQADATIALQGAQLIAWTPRGQAPVIWLSRAARFAPGSAIGDNVIVAMGSVVTKKFDVSRAMLGGVPATVLKKDYDWRESERK